MEIEKAKRSEEKMRSLNIKERVRHRKRKGPLLRRGRGKGAATTA